MKTLVSSLAWSLLGALLLAVAMVEASHAKPKPAELSLVSEGHPAVVVITEEGADAIDASVQLLADYVAKISGATLTRSSLPAERLSGGIAQIRKEGRTPLLIGSPTFLRSVEPGLSAESRSTLANPEGFVLLVSPEHLLLVASDPLGIDHGIHELLEQLGVRWFFPGELGEVIPSRTTLHLPLQETAQQPSFASRHFQLSHSEAWIRHQRTGGPRLPGAHGIPIGKEFTVETAPEYFALVKGERNANQLCISHPDVLKHAITQTKAYFAKRPQEPWIGMGPNDGGGFCECERCSALDGGDWDPFSNDKSVTDRYVHFFNKVLEGIRDDYPDKKIVFYVYHTYMRPPVAVKPNPKIVAAVAAISLCRLHGVENRYCPEKSYLKQIVTAWSAIIPEVYERGYWFNLADPGMLFIQTSRLQEDISFHASQGVKGFRTECLGQWAVEGPSLYVAGKLMWNAEADAHALVADFCYHLFGKAAEPMQRYFSLLDEQIATADSHTGSAFDLLRIFPATARAKAHGMLNEALAAELSPLERQRVALFARGFAYHDTFAQMLEARNSGAWAKAWQALQEMDRLQKELVEEAGAPMLHPTAAAAYLRRFFRLPIEQAYQRTREGNRIIAPLSEKWAFLIDPQQIGEALHYERADLRGGNWQSISTQSSWSDQGLRYYKGLAWYRQVIHVPAEEVGKRLFLWLGGVDESARVWINGQLAGTSPKSAFTPFELDCTKLVQAGENSVVVCVANLQVDELGSGGITAPGFLYAPALGDKAELENIRPLRNTFP